MSLKEKQRQKNEICWNNPMNKTNNLRRRETVTKIWKAYLRLVISRSDISTITVSDICKKAGINRTTFYSIYLDIDDLKNSIEQWMMEEFLNTFKRETETQTHSMDFQRLFQSIKENQIFYRIYFKLGFDFKKTFVENEPTELWKRYFSDEKTTRYHIEFFAAGITAVIRMWLDEGCPGKAEKMSEFLKEEYRNRTF